MNKQVIYIAGTFVIGAVTGALVTDKVLSNTMEKRFDEESRRIQEDYARYYAGKSVNQTPIEEFIEQHSSDDGAPEVGTIRSASAASEKREQTDYTTMYNGDSDAHPVMDLDRAQSLVNKTSAQTQPIKDELAREGEDNSEDEEPEEELHNIFKDKVLPPDFDRREEGGTYLLTVEEFMADPKDSGYTDVNLTWFEDGNTLILEDDESIVMEADTIGTEALRHFGWSPDHSKDTIFVRNENTQIDFEVTKDERSYAEVMLGFSEDDKPPHRKYTEDD